MDKFYGLVFGDSRAFYKLCMALPDIIEDVVSDNEAFAVENTVYGELAQTNGNILVSIYLLAFSTYEGFNDITTK